jgi:hypothetical protein
MGLISISDMDFSLGLAFDRFVMDQLTRRRRRTTNPAWQFIKEKY